MIFKVVSQARLCIQWSCTWIQNITWKSRLKISNTSKTSGVIYSQNTIYNYIVYESSSLCDGNVNRKLYFERLLGIRHRHNKQVHCEVYKSPTHAHCPAGKVHKLKVQRDFHSKTVWQIGKALWFLGSTTEGWGAMNDRDRGYWTSRLEQRLESPNSLQNSWNDHKSSYRTVTKVNKWRKWNQNWSDELKISLKALMHSNVFLKRFGAL